MHLEYPVTLRPMKNGTVMAKFVDVPEALTCGRDEKEALRLAQEALVLALTEAYMTDRRSVPAPSKPKRGQRTVALPPLVAAKLAVYQAMQEEGVTQVELAARLHQDDRQVRRLLDLKHRSRLDMLDRALHALGRQMVLEVKRVA
ncbi:MAG TPA: type II toxin-antitoxin system HicB family antitoxin [Desulfobaccales bacterium]